MGMRMDMEIRGPGGIAGFFFFCGVENGRHKALYGIHDGQSSASWSVRSYMCGQPGMIHNVPVRHAANVMRAGSRKCF